jgi:hypothetical protein
MLFHQVLKQILGWDAPHTRSNERSALSPKCAVTQLQIVVSITLFAY